MVAHHSREEHDGVLVANAAFYRAFESLNLTRMEDVWLRAAHVKCIHPGWGTLVGWGPVMESWQRIFANTVAMRFTLTAIHVDVVGDLAWVVLTENLESQHREGSTAAQVQATNIFERHDSRWFLVHHHGSPVYTPSEDSGPEQMH